MVHFSHDQLLKFFFTVLDINQSLSLNLPSGDLSVEGDVPFPGCYTSQIFYQYAETTRHSAQN